MLPTFICSFSFAKAVQKAKLDFCGERRIWSGEVLNREIKGHSVLYIYYEVWIINQSDNLLKNINLLYLSCTWLVDIILTSNTLCSSLRLEEQHYTDHLEFLLIIVIIIIIIIIIITVFIQGGFHHWKVVFSETLWNVIKAIHK